jgi:alkanesulfonate monooxygenase SsuD/methylene tetrahydromethanopterin reductase-like flavin-dependent oxidoreductase (luciferase family)
MLSFVASATTKLRVQTGIVVLPYRNPFITARAVATLDVYSGGRVTLGLGAGYLKGEYRALGVDFERRNDIMDEYCLFSSRVRSVRTHGADAHNMPPGGASIGLGHR